MVELLLLEDGARRPAANMAFAADDRIEVCDLRAQVKATIRASEISLYRHAVILKGKAYRILNIVAAFAPARAA